MRSLLVELEIEIHASIPDFLDKVEIGARGMSYIIRVLGEKDLTHGHSGLSYRPNCG